MGAEWMRLRPAKGAALVARMSRIENSYSIALPGD